MGGYVHRFEPLLMVDVKLRDGLPVGLPFDVRDGVAHERFDRDVFARDLAGAFGPLSRNALTAGILRASRKHHGAHDRYEQR